MMYFGYGFTGLCITLMLYTLIKEILKIKKNG